MTRLKRFSTLCLTMVIAGSAAQAMVARQPELGAVCAPEIERFCPHLAGTTQPQNQRICLKPYRTSLSIGCRHVLAAPHKPMH